MTLKECGLGEQVHPEVLNWYHKIDNEELKIWIEDIFRNDAEYLRYDENRPLRNAGYIAQEIIYKYKEQIDNSPKRLKDFIHGYAENYKQCKAE